MRGFGERVIAVVDEQAVRAVVRRDVDVLEAVVVQIGVPDVERPAGMARQPRLRRDVFEPAVAEVPPERDAAAVRRVVQVGRQHVRIAQVEQVDRFEVVAEEQVEAAVVVVVERARGDRVRERVEARARRDVGERAVAVVAIENRRPEPRDANGGTHRALGRQRD